jgi:hypothetical protein
MVVVHLSEEGREKPKMRIQNTGVRSKITKFRGWDSGHCFPTTEFEERGE